MQETQVQFLGWKDHLEKGMATYSSILAWEIPWTCSVRKTKQGKILKREVGRPGLLQIEWSP